MENPFIQSEKFPTDAHSTDFNFRMYAGEIHDRKIIHVYRKRHERPVIYLAFVYFVSRQSPRITA